MKLEFNVFFDVDEHFKKIHRKIIKCKLTQPVYLSLGEMMPDFFEIFYQDIEGVIYKLYEDINYQCAMKRIKFSKKSFRKLIDDGFPILFNNYKGIVAGMQGGGLLRNNTNKAGFGSFEYKAQKLYNQTSRRLFLQAKMNERASINNWLILGCSIIAAITGIIGLFKP